MPVYPKRSLNSWTVDLQFQGLLHIEKKKEQLDKKYLFIK